MSRKIPTERTIYNDTIQKMKALKTHNVAYNRLVKIYAQMIHQYSSILSEWEDQGSPLYTESAAGSFKKHPSVDYLEKLRKDILSYSNQLMLNPKSVKDIEIEEPKQENPFDKLFASLNVDDS